MRLTIRNSDGTVSQPMNLNWSAALEKLAAYEDAEEQGRLVPVVHGRWINEPGHIPHCSECGRYSDDADTGEAICCPFCGAIMDKDGDRNG